MGLDWLRRQNSGIWEVIGYWESSLYNLAPKGGFWGANFRPVFDGFGQGFWLILFANFCKNRGH
jgi:hypothetical protein